MICAMVHQLTRNLSDDTIMASGFAPYFVDHTTGVYPIAAAGIPWRAEYIGVKGDAITDLHEDNLIRLIDDPDVLDPLRFLRQRELNHYQRFDEALEITTDRLNRKNYYACNPAFDKNCGK